MSDDLISRSALKKVISEYIEEYSDLDAEGNHCEKWCAIVNSRNYANFRR